MIITIVDIFYVNDRNERAAASTSEGGLDSDVEQFISYRSREKCDLSDCDDDEASVGSEESKYRGDFASLVEEIHINGEVNAVKPVVFDRLTDPNNFTGSQRNVFLTEKVSKREVINVSVNEQKEKGWDKSLRSRANVSDRSVPQKSTFDRRHTPSPVTRTASKSIRDTGSPNNQIGGPANFSSGTQQNDTNSVFSRLNNPSQYTGVSRYRGPSDSIDDSQILLSSSAGGVRGSSITPGIYNRPELFSQSVDYLTNNRKSSNSSMSSFSSATSPRKIGKGTPSGVNPPPSSLRHSLPQSISQSLHISMSDTQPRRASLTASGLRKGKERETIRLSIDDGAQNSLLHSMSKSSTFSSSDDKELIQQPQYTEDCIVLATTAPSTLTTSSVEDTFNTKLGTISPK